MKLDAGDRMIRVPFGFSYRGDRNYVHGTSMYDRLTDHISEQMPERSRASFHMVIHGFATHRCDFIYTLDADLMARPERGCAEVSTSSGIHGWLVETDDEVTQRQPYPEEEITARCRLDGDGSVRMLGRVPYRPIEILVAITKHLHYCSYPEARGKWIFTRLELDRFLVDEDGGQLAVNIRKSIGTKLTQSDIHSGDAKIGEIYFSMVAA